MKMLKRIAVITAFLVSLMLMHHNELLMISIGVRKMPDMQVMFSVNGLRDTLAILRSKAQFTYLQYLVIDCLFTVSFAIIQNGILRYILRMSERLKRFQWMCRFAQMRAGFDLTENMIFISLLFGSFSMWQYGCALAEVVTSIKFLMYGLWILSVCSMLIAAVFLKMRGEKE
jgi:CRISPR/Cas system CMR-associated protein Cmr5 small subunit